MIVEDQTELFHSIKNQIQYDNTKMKNNSLIRNDLAVDSLCLPEEEKQRIEWPHKTQSQLLEVMEETREQFNLRKAFLSKIGMKEEKLLYNETNINRGSIKGTLIQNLSCLSPQQQIRSPQYYPNCSDAAELEDNSNDPYYTSYSLEQSQLIPPISSGESTPYVSDSAEEDQVSPHHKFITKTSMKDVLRYLIDSSLICSEKESSSPDNIHEILLVQIDLSLSSEKIREGILKGFSRHSFTIHFKSFRSLYYQGKYSTLVILKEPEQLQPAYNYFKINIDNFKRVLGHHLEVYKVFTNNLNLCDLPQKQDEEESITSQNETGVNQIKLKNWLPIVLRNLPMHYDKGKVIRELQMLPIDHSTILRIEEPILLNQRKHSLVLMDGLESALLVIKFLPISLKDKQLRVNLHPNYSKQSFLNTSFQERHFLQRFYKQNQLSDESQTPQSYIPHHNYRMHRFPFRRDFLEDLDSVHQLNAQKRKSFIDSQHKFDNERSYNSISPLYSSQRQKNTLDNVEPPDSYFSPTMFSQSPEMEENQVFNHNFFEEKGKQFPFSHKFYIILKEKLQCSSNISHTEGKNQIVFTVRSRNNSQNQAGQETTQNNLDTATTTTNNNQNCQFNKNIQSSQQAQELDNLIEDQNQVIERKQNSLIKAALKERGEGSIEYQEIGIPISQNSNPLPSILEDNNKNTTYTEQLNQRERENEYNRLDESIFQSVQEPKEVINIEIGMKVNENKMKMPIFTVSSMQEQSAEKKAQQPQQVHQNTQNEIKPFQVEGSHQDQDATISINSSTNEEQRSEENQCENQIKVEIAIKVFQNSIRKKSVSTSDSKNNNAREKSSSSSGKKQETNIPKQVSNKTPQKNPIIEITLPFNNNNAFNNTIPKIDFEEEDNQDNNNFTLFMPTLQTVHNQQEQIKFSIISPPSNIPPINAMDYQRNSEQKEKEDYQDYSAGKQQHSSSKQYWYEPEVRYDESDKCDIENSLHPSRQLSLNNLDYQSKQSKQFSSFQPQDTSHVFNDFSYQFNDSSYAIQSKNFHNKVQPSEKSSQQQKPLNSSKESMKYQIKQDIQLFDVEQIQTDHILYSSVQKEKQNPKIKIKRNKESILSHSHHHSEIPTCSSSNYLIEIDDQLPSHHNHSNNSPNNSILLKKKDQKSISEESILNHLSKRSLSRKNRDNERYFNSLNIPSADKVICIDPQINSSKRKEKSTRTIRPYQMDLNKEDIFIGYSHENTKQKSEIVIKEDIKTMKDWMNQKQLRKNNNNSSEIKITSSEQVLRKQKKLNKYEDYVIPYQGSLTSNQEPTFEESQNPLSKLLTGQFVTDEARREGKKDVIVIVDNHLKCSNKFSDTEESPLQRKQKKATKQILVEEKRLSAQEQLKKLSKQINNHINQFEQNPIQNQKAKKQSSDTEQYFRDRECSSARKSVNNESNNRSSHAINMNNVKQKSIRQSRSRSRSSDNSQIDY